MDEAKVMGVLRDIEWVQGGAGVSERYCPWCHWAKTAGHRDGCKLAALVDELKAKKERIVAIMGGGDWYDASVEHLVLPSDIDLNAEYQAYEEWYHQQYFLARETGEGTPFLTFSAWLIQQGARRTTDDEVLGFWKDARHDPYESPAPTSIIATIR